MANAVSFEQPGVRGFLHRPEKAGENGLVVTHGAGGNCNSPLLVRVAEVFAAAGLSVLRCDLPFRQRRPAGPPSPATAAADREGLRHALAAMRSIVPVPVALGGLSYGGRQASMLAAEQPEMAAALLLLSYPLHAPGKPERLRTEHFRCLSVPIVFVHGTRDPFGSVAELQAAVAAIPAPTQILPIDGAGHDLKQGRFDLGPVVRALVRHLP